MPRVYAKSTQVKFIYSEKATKFWEISTLLLSYVVPVKSKVEISQNFVASSEYMNFISIQFLHTYIHWNSFTHNIYMGWDLVVFILPFRQFLIC